jgi:hypothetical protein
LAAQLAVPRSFRSISKTTRVLNSTAGLTCTFPAAAPGDDSDAARIIGDLYLYSLSALLQSAQGYSVAVDGGDDGNGIKFFDVRGRVLVQTEIMDLHACIIPESESATGSAVYEMLDRIMSSLDPPWLANIVGICTDGASAMTGWSAGLASASLKPTVAPCTGFGAWPIRTLSP